MAETFQVDLSGVERRIMSLELTINKNAEELKGQITGVSTKLEATQAELEKLKKDFEEMIMEQRRTASLQQAATELVTVRQSLEKNFGNYRIVRNTMLGILGATDSALVRKATVSSVSEELMISTPDYWLAPVLVALSAWIGNDRDLAERALREAVRRDNEHTSLVMALICRRNNRTATCYEWLSRYFATQDGANLDEDTMVYIDAYINGIFGSDEKHMCDDYVTRWIDEIRGQDSNFEEEQAETWNQYFNRFNVDEGGKYPTLKNCCEQFGYINEFLERADAVNEIQEKFQGIQNAYVDQNALRKAVDEHLVKLVSADDVRERELREQEKYLLAVKACQGDVEAARNVIRKQKEEEKSRTMNIIEQLTHIISDDERALPSQKKTAVSFLHGYINKGYNKYIAEKKNSFPDKINLRVNGWSGETVDGSNEEALINSHNAYLLNELTQKKNKLLVSNNSRTMNIIAAVLAVIGLPFLLLSLFPVTILLWIGACFTFYSGKKKVKDIENEIAAADKQYQQQLASGRETIHQCCEQWKRATDYVRSFEKQRPENIVA